MSVLVLTGSTRSGSTTRHLGAALADLSGAVLADPVDAPSFSQDPEADLPAAVRRLREQVAAADLVVAVTPEYDGTVPGLLGNAVDWLSRPYGALRGQQVLAVAAAPGPGGDRRALASLETLLAITGADVRPGLSVLHVERRLTDDGVDDALRADLGRLLRPVALAA